MYCKCAYCFNRKAFGLHYKQLYIRKLLHKQLSPLFLLYKKRGADCTEWQSKISIKCRSCTRKSEINYDKNMTEIKIYQSLEESKQIDERIFDYSNIYMNI